jgi:hypothetical protein
VSCDYRFLFLPPFPSPLDNLNLFIIFSASRSVEPVIAWQTRNFVMAIQLRPPKFFHLLFQAWSCRQRLQSSVSHRPISIPVHLNNIPLFFNTSKPLRGRTRRGSLLSFLYRILLLINCFGLVYHLTASCMSSPVFTGHS